MQDFFYTVTLGFKREFNTDSSGVSIAIEIGNYTRDTDCHIYNRTTMQL